MPTFPAVGAPSIAPSSSVVVVFPFVPVTPTIGFSSSREASSISDQTGIPRSARGCDERGLARHPRALDQHVDAVEQRELAVVPERSIRRHDLDTSRFERRLRRQARPRQAEHQDSAERHSRNWR